MASTGYPTNADFDVTTPEGRRAFANWVKAGLPQRRPEGVEPPDSETEVIFVFDDSQAA